MRAHTPTHIHTERERGRIYAIHRQVRTHQIAIDPQSTERKRDFSPNTSLR